MHPHGPRPDESRTERFLCRVNERSNYADRLGRVYNFSENLANHRQVRAGSILLFDRGRIDNWIILGYATVASLSRVFEGRSNKWGPVRDIYADLMKWVEFSPGLEVASNLASRIAASPGYNPQFAIRQISRALFDEILESAVSRSAVIASPESGSTRSKKA